MADHYPRSICKSCYFWDSNDPKNLLLRFYVQATLAVAVVSSAYSGGIDQILLVFDIGTEVATLGISLFVLGFASGPLLWAPMSELYGRQVLFFGTYAALTAFNAGAAESQNIQTLLILRFFASAFGSSPLTNAGSVIADIVPALQRGLAMSAFASAPFLGPTLVRALGLLGTGSRRYGRCNDIFTKTKERSMKWEPFAPYIHSSPLTSFLRCPFYATQLRILGL
jgi:MFS family permease